MSSKSFGLVAAASIIIASVLVGGIVGNPAYKIFSSGNRTDRAAPIEQAYTEAVSTVAANYTDQIDYEKANQAAIQGMLNALDPHSNFFTKTEYTKLLQDQDSRYVGRCRMTARSGNRKSCGEICPVAALRCTPE